MSTTFSTRGIRNDRSGEPGLRFDAFDNEDAVAGLLIQERSAPEMALWRTTGDAQDRLSLTPSATTISTPWKP